MSKTFKFPIDFLEIQFQFWNAKTFEGEIQQWKVVLGPVQKGLAFPKWNEISKTSIENSEV